MKIYGSKTNRIAFVLMAILACDSALARQFECKWTKDSKTHIVGKITVPMKAAAMSSFCGINSEFENGYQVEPARIDQCRREMIDLFLEDSENMLDKVSQLNILEDHLSQLMQLTADNIADYLLQSDEPVTISVDYSKGIGAEESEFSPFITLKRFYKEGNFEQYDLFKDIKSKDEMKNLSNKISGSTNISKTSVRKDLTGAVNALYVWEYSFDEDQTFYFSKHKNHIVVSRLDRNGGILSQERYKLTEKEQRIVIPFQVQKKSGDLSLDAKSDVVMVCRGIKH